MVCELKRVRDQKEKNTMKLAENPAPRIRGVKGIQSCFNRVQTIKISHCYQGLTSLVGMVDSECPPVSCDHTDAASMAYLLEAAEFPQRRVLE